MTTIFSMQFPQPRPCLDLRLLPFLFQLHTMSFRQLHLFQSLRPLPKLILHPLTYHHPFLSLLLVYMLYHLKIAFHHLLLLLLVLSIIHSSFARRPLNKNSRPLVCRPRVTPPTPPTMTGSSYQRT